MKVTSGAQEHVDGLPCSILARDEKENLPEYVSIESAKPYADTNPVELILVELKAQTKLLSQIVRQLAYLG